MGETSLATGNPIDARLSWLIPAACLLLFGIAFYAAIEGAVAVWWINETYHHCFLAVPMAIWFFRQEYRALSGPWQGATMLPLLGMLGACVLWLVGSFMQVQVLIQAAAVGLLILCVPLCLGWRATARLWFPLVLLIYAVPIGEEMTPFLQVITVHMATGLLRLFGVTSVTEGMYITTLAGNFHVAEACAGVKFLISTSMLGVVTSYLYFRDWFRRLGFIVFCLVVPVLANGLRVFLTIMIGDWFGMEYVDGFDHLVYGWVLFALIFVMIIYLADRWGDPVPAPLPADNPQPWPPLRLLVPCGLLVMGLLIIHFGSTTPQQLGEGGDDPSPAASVALGANVMAVRGTLPAGEFAGFTVHEVVIDQNTWAEIGHYDGAQYSVELAPPHILGVQEPWAIRQRSVVQIEEGFQVQQLELKHATERSRLWVLSWYQWPDGHTEHARLPAKLQQLRRSIEGEGRGGHRIALYRYADATRSMSNAARELQDEANLQKRALFHVLNP